MVCYVLSDSQERIGQNCCVDHIVREDGFRMNRSRIFALFDINRALLQGNGSDFSKLTPTYVANFFFSSKLSFLQ
jgi:hypothetical protein